MKAFVITILILTLYSVGFRLAAAAIFGHPRKQNTTLGMDLFGIALSLALAAWASWLLWGGA